jgi:hypothetical protein
MHNKYDALINNETWKLVDPPFSCKCVYNNKYILDDSLDKNKNRLVEKGYTQKYVIDKKNQNLKKIPYYNKTLLLSHSICRICNIV